MAQNDYNLAKQRTRNYIGAVGIEHHMFYGPVATDYWSAPLRVLAINMEPYGYEKCGHVEVDLECLLDWMYDRGEENTRTVRYTLAITRSLMDGYTEGVIPSYESLQRAYAEVLKLKTVARKVAYYNIRPTSNSNKNQDFASIVASGKGAISEFIRNEMLALEPEVILVSGVAGLASFNAMWNLAPALSYLSRIRHSNGSLIQSIRHPSRPNYAKYALAIAEVSYALNEKYDTAT